MLATAYAPLLDAVRALRWPARRRVGGTLPGAHRARLRGPGGEFSEYRAYRQGDDPRRLDWRLLARSDRAYVRLADDHALLPTIFVMDASASMAYPDEGDGQHWGKWRQACALVVGLAAVAHGAGDPVGVAVATAGGARALAARSRRGVVHELATLLDAVRPAGAAPVTPLAEHQPAGCRLVLVSDFLGTDAESLRAAGAAHAAAGGDVHALHVVAAAELDVPRAVRVAADPEDERVRRPLDAASRLEYLRTFAAWRAELARTWRDAGAAYTLVRDDEPSARAVRRVVRGEPTDGGAEGASDGTGAAGTAASPTRPGSRG